MTIRYIIRPSDILTTPRKLKEAFNAQRTLAFPFQGTRRPSVLKDFFLTYPPIEEIEEYAQSLSNPSNRQLLVSRANSESRSRSISRSMESLEDTSRRLANYSLVREFFSKNKPLQRLYLAEHCGFSIPWTRYGSTSGGTMETNNQQPTFCSRPTRHRAGSGWNLLSESQVQELTQRPDSFTTSREEYIQQVLPKNYEYRIIICKGKALITLLKRNIENLSPLVPWNHQHGSSFVTVENIENNRLRRTDIYQKIENAELLKHIDLCAIDVLYLKNPARYFLLELNFCPGLTIDSNIEKVKNHVNQVSS